MLGKNLEEYILEQYPGGMYILDAEKKYIYANDTYLDMLGVNRNELMYRDVHELMEAGKYDICISDIVFEQRREVSVFSNVLVNKAGVIRYKRFLIRAIPIFDENGYIRNMLSLCESTDYLNGCYYEASSRSFASWDSSVSISESKHERDELYVIAESPIMKRVMSDAKKAAKVDSTILITGDSGTGKEVIAEYIHRNSCRKNKDMVVVNCAGISPNLLESILYGYVKGAFTGALSTGKQGMIESAHGGTLFLDEINSLPLELQSKLLRTIETKEVQKVGSNHAINVDFRLLAATNQDLMQMVKNGSFREDLYYRLNIIPIVIPPLSSRREDIIPFIKFFLDLYGERYNKKLMLNEEVLRKLVTYPWHGNVRELRNVIERMVVMLDSEYVNVSSLDEIIGMVQTVEKLGGEITTYQVTSSDMSTSNGLLEEDQCNLKRMLQERVPLSQYIEKCEKAYIAKALEETGSSYKAAEALDVSQSLIMRRKTKYRL